MSVSKVKYLTAIFFFFVVTCILQNSSSACTGIQVKAKDGAVVWARSMEFGSYIDSALMVSPLGMKWTSPAPNEAKGLHWTAKYGFVGPDGFNLHVPLEGMNEKGLYVGGFWMKEGETKFPDVKQKDYSRTVAQTHFVVWALTNFSTVDELKAALPKITIAGLKVASINKVIYCHWSVMDSTGKIAAIESINGKVTITDNPVGVFTNSPSFEWHLKNLSQYINLRPENVASTKLGKYKVLSLGEGTGLLGLPGDFTPPSRFVRAAILANSVLQPENADSAVNVAMNLIAGTNITRGISKGITDNGQPEYDYTQWTTVYDTSRKAVYVRTYEDQNYKVVHFNKLSFAGKKNLTIPLGQAYGSYDDISNQAK
ncbi:linear amide C-N hydrolase [Maridesulfovibrio sp.]|uniref:linear amide C-N hydrolase n=1 Tax=Maridesulfovibrio sp. TaxID=2795000 RepID=UPI0029F4EBC1|nr:linear amide C-N hydrolase [Maridesulfovibrio sp.]